MRPLILAALLLAPLAAQAQQPKPDMVLLPRTLAEAAAQWMQQPDPTSAIRIYAALLACLADNPVNGRVVRQGADQCPAVTAALAERDKALAGAQKPEQPGPH